MQHILSLILYVGMLIPGLLLASPLGTQGGSAPIPLFECGKCMAALQGLPVLLYMPDCDRSLHIYFRSEFGIGSTSLKMGRPALSRQTLSKWGQVANRVVTILYIKSSQCKMVRIRCAYSRVIGAITQALHTCNMTQC